MKDSAPPPKKPRIPPLPPLTPSHKVYMHRRVKERLHGAKSLRILDGICFNDRAEVVCWSDTESTLFAAYCRQEFGLDVEIL